MGEGIVRRFWGWAFFFIAVFKMNNQRQDTCWTAQELFQRYMQLDAERIWERMVQMSSAGSLPVTEATSIVKSAIPQHK